MAKMKEELIQKRLETIKEASEISCTLREICNYTDLTYAQMSYLLKKYSETKKIVEKNVNKNKSEKRSKTIKKIAEPKEASIAAEPVEEEKEKSEVILDSSIAGIPNILNLLKFEFSDRVKVLTTITVSELEKMKKYKNFAGINAAKILKMAADDEESFRSYYVCIKGNNAHMSFLRFCEEHKDRAILLTANTGMAVNARALKVKTRFIMKDYTDKEAQQQFKSCTKQSIITLFDTWKFGNQLFLRNYPCKKIFVNGILLMDRIHELNVGDDIFIIKKNVEYSTFSHFRIIALQENDNASFIYGIRLYKKIPIDFGKIPNQYAKAIRLYCNL